MPVRKAFNDDGYFSYVSSQHILVSNVLQIRLNKLRGHLQKMCVMSIQYNDTVNKQLAPSVKHREVERKK